jgi:ElaB/YqjD/DUF883 family membrane-anchored ribosome-binding protein
MENSSSKPYAGKTPLSESAQRLVSDIKSEAGGLADRAGEAAKTFGDHASEAFDDLKSAGQGVVDEYAAKVARGRRQIRVEAAGRISEYSDQNTALVIGGALLVGVLLGHILTRKGE